MRKSKGILKEYASGFSFFYSHLGNKVFIILILSLVMSFLDALGLSMFLPLLQLLNTEGTIDPSSMGKLAAVVETIQNLGISLNLTKIIVVMLFFFILKGIVKYFGSVYLIRSEERRVGKELTCGGWVEAQENDRGR